MVRAYSRTEIVPKEIDDDLVGVYCIDFDIASVTFELLSVLPSMLLFEVASATFELLSVLSAMMLLLFIVSLSC